MVFPLNREKIRLISMAMVGNFLELYDFSLYGVLVPLIAPLYFPHADPFIGQIMALGVFTIGFLSRPLGALIFGIIGDRKGRKAALMSSVILMGVATGCMGILPTYSQIGIVAPCLLIFLRILQGISTGGESNGSVVFVMEHFPSHQRGLASSLVSAATISGVILSTFLASVLTRSGMPEGAWRWCFIIGGFIGFFGFFIRRNLHESPLFQQIMSENQLSKAPLRETFKYAPVALMQTFLISAAAGALQLTLAGFINIYLVDHLKLSFSLVALLSSGSLVFYALILPLAGFVADRVNPLRLLLTSCALALLLMIPIYKLLQTQQLVLIILAQAILAVICALYMGAKSVTLFQLFKTRIRFTGMSLGYTAGISLFGGFTPIISKTLINFNYTPALFPMMCALISGCTLCFMSRSKT